VSLERIPPLAEGIRLVGESMSAFLALMAEAQPAIDSIVQEMGRLAAAGDSASGGFIAAQEAGAAFADSLGSVDSAIDATIGKLIAMKDAAEKALAAASKAASAGGGGGGESTPQAGRYGGISGALSETQRVSDSVFGTAPALRSGTSNTNKFISKVSGGGIPSILHPNEAVVPLPKGGKIPVDIRTVAKQETSKKEATTKIDTTPIARSIDRFSSNAASVIGRFHGGSDATSSPSKEATAGAGGSGLFFNPQPQGRQRTQDGLDTPAIKSKTKTNSTSGEASAGGKAPVYNIYITVNATDSDSFKKSEDQIVRGFVEKVKRANRRVN
jgi:hypothetical protein